VRAHAEFSWTSEDDSTPLQASDLYQFENAAAMYFSELLGDWLKEHPTQNPLTTKVSIVDQQVALSPTGEKMEFRLPSTVDFTYIGEEEIPTLAATLEEITKGTPAYEALKRLVNSSPASSFSVKFSDPARDPSTFLYMVQDDESPNAQTGLIVACTLAAAALLLSSLILLWAIGAFDNWKTCKDLRSHFFMHSPRPQVSEIPYGVKTKSTCEETEDGSGKIGAQALYRYDEEDSCPGDGGGFEITPRRGIFRIDELESPNSSESQMSDTYTNFSDGTSTTLTDASRPLGIASMRRLKRNISVSPTNNTISPLHTMNTMSPESILADIKSFQLGKIEPVD
jgi:hypothetical protein